jgi:hypothetical protein
LLLLFDFVDLDSEGVQFGEDAGHDVAIIGGGIGHVVEIAGNGTGVLVDRMAQCRSSIVVGSRCYEEEQ